MELLICIADAGTRCQPGDVIDARPDGWAWSAAECQNPAWAIVSCDLTPVEAEALSFMQPGAPRLDVTDLPATLTRAELYARADL